MEPRLAAVALALLLAGCSGDSEAADDPGGSAAPDAGAGDAILDVLVVDEAIRPLAGAAMRLGGADLSATSDAAGATRFTGLAPGAYVLEVERTGYFAAQVVVTVAAPDGSPPRPIVVALVADDTAVRYVEETVEDIFVDLSFTVGPDDNDLSFSAGGIAVELPAGVPDFVQVEATWSSTQPLGNQMRINYFVCPNGANICEAIQGTKGTTPIVVAAAGSAIVDAGYVTDGDLHANLWAVHDSPAGAGVILQQQVRMTTHKFYGFVPVDDWLFSRDGEPVPPV